MSLDDIFEPQPQVEEASETTAQEVADPVVDNDQPSGELKSQEIKSEETKAEPKTADSEEEKGDWTFDAVKNLRREKQELRAELEALKSKLSNPAPQERDISVFDDEKGAFDKIRSEYRQELANVKIELAREMMMESHPDYEEMEALFINEIAPKNPLFKTEIQQARNPAKAVYDLAKKHQEFEQMKNIDSYKEKLKAELKKELEQELKGKAQAKSEKVADITPSLAKARASDKDTFEPSSLESLFAR